MQILSAVDAGIPLSMPILLAQESVPQAQFSAGQLILSLALYLIIAFFCWKIFEKLNVENAWFAWIPILGTYIAFVAADEENPILWTVLAFIPCINIVAAIKLILAWIRICGKLNKTPWILLLCLIPVIGPIACFAYLAFG